MIIGNRVKIDKDIDSTSKRVIKDITGNQEFNSAQR